MSVIVPVDVPFSRTLAPMTASLLVSVTVPEIVMFCAASPVGMANKKSKSLKTATREKLPPPRFGCKFFINSILGK